MAHWGKRSREGKVIPSRLLSDKCSKRRTGGNISARGIDRDPARSSQGHFVKASGLCCLSLMLLPPLPWAHRIWTLPFLTARVPSEGVHQQRGHRHKTLLVWARQMLRLVQRWCSGRGPTVVDDSAQTLIAWLQRLRQGHPITGLHPVAPGRSALRTPSRTSSRSDGPPAKAHAERAFLLQVETNADFNRGRTVSRKQTGAAPEKERLG
ncbi:hypothetical protein SAMN00790413_05624 [Deinococcus hopiensis KR-140]|uniref:Uncharacterized protein n=1 Tax=Deinococcus hopiensis KR-140 TaxID=695939 RepID=A0A1W1UCH4_9DEIO|nr:hypothetical protein SAMN00790413_05624 [Deinococcus hopiensis KR-140]